MKPSQFGNVCTKFELDPSNENRAIKKIRWVGQIRPGPFHALLSVYILGSSHSSTPGPWSHWQICMKHLIIFKKQNELGNK